MTKRQEVMTIAAKKEGLAILVGVAQTDSGRKAVIGGLLDEIRDLQEKVANVESDIRQVMAICEASYPDVAGFPPRDAVSTCVHRLAAECLRLRACPPNSLLDSQAPNPAINSQPEAQP